MAKVIRSYRLKSLDGVKDLKFGPAAIDAREDRVFSKGPENETLEKDEEGFDDVKARRERYADLSGFFI